MDGEVFATGFAVAKLMDAGLVRLKYSDIPSDRIIRHTHGVPSQEHTGYEIHKTELELYVYERERVQFLYGYCEHCNKVWICVM